MFILPSLSEASGGLAAGLSGGITGGMIPTITLTGTTPGGIGTTPGGIGTTVIMSTMITSGMDGTPCFIAGSTGATGGIGLQVGFLG